MTYPQIPTHLVPLIAIDPGSFRCGVSIFMIDMVKKKIVSIEAFTIKVDSLRNDTGYLEELVPAASIRFFKLRNEITRILRLHKPEFIAYESPFMYKQQPTAYGPLVSVMTLIHEAIIMYRLSIPFNTFTPLTVKKTIKVAGKKGKEVVIEALRKVEEVMSVLKTDIETLDDNGVDSIAIGLTFFREIIQKSNDV